MRAVLITAVSLCSVPCFAQGFANQRPVDSRPAFQRVAETLKQMVRFELRGSRLRVRRDHWEVAAKRPSATEQRVIDEAEAEEQRRKKVSEDQIKRLKDAGAGEERIKRVKEMGLRFNPSRFRLSFRDHKGIERLFSRLRTETTGGSGSSGGGTGRHGGIRRRFDNRALRASIETSDDHYEFEISEVSDKHRHLSLADSEDATRLLLTWPNGDLLFYLESQSGAVLCLLKDGTVWSTCGDSFAAIAQRDEKRLRETIEPLFSETGLLGLPVDAALKVEGVDTDSTGTFSSAEPEGPIIDNAEVVGDLFDFRVVDGRLKVDRFEGNSTLLDREIKTVRDAHTAAIDAAAKRMEDRGMLPQQVQQLKAAVALDRFGVQSAGLSQEPLLVGKFNAIGRAMGRGSAGGTGGGDAYEREFGGLRGSGSLAVTKELVDFSLRDASGNVSARDYADRAMCSAIIEHAGLVAMVVQSEKSCVMIKIDSGKIESLTAKDYLSLVVEHEDAFRQTFLPTFTRFGLGSLDPFSEELTQAITKALSEGLPRDFDPAGGATQEEDRIFPVLGDRRYLGVMRDRTEDTQVKELLTKRIEAIKPAK